MKKTKLKPPFLSEIKKITNPIRNVNIEYKENLSASEKAAVWVTEHVGSTGFFAVIFFWTIFWFLWNTNAPARLRFDHYPAFVLWLFISNMIQLFLLPLLLIGQNLQGKHSETRSEIDFEINVKAEKEIETILLHLERQNDLILKIIKKIEAMKKISAKKR
ncbi:MAG: DUF1003 domain-containing protein [Patescibacteria group bacterium]|nr:DUF1003 domain-containing protein [Patescibacteria group bacterium]